MKMNIKKVCYEQRTFLWISTHLSQVVKIVLVPNPLVFSNKAVRFVCYIPCILPLADVELSLEQLFREKERVNQESFTS